MNSKLTVIIVNYKSWNYLSKCLDSLIEQDSGTPNIVVVDNFSNDGKIQEFESQYKSVKWIKLSKKWNYSKFPVVMGGNGQPVLCLHGFDSSFLEFRRIYPLLKSSWS